MSRRHIASLSKPWDFWFDGGAAASVAEDTGKIRITPRFDWNSQWLYWAIRSDRMGGKTPHFLIAKAGRFDTAADTETMAFWATRLDTDTWYKFDNQTTGASDTEFYNNAPFPNGTIYVAQLPLYPFSRITRKFHEWIKDTRVTLKYAGQSTPRPSVDGRRAPGAPYYGMLITNASGYTKNNLVLAARSHPNETQGNWQLEGAMDWLLAGSAEAEFLLDWFNVLVYPCTNPQGAVCGYFRNSPGDATDHNRIWDDNDNEDGAAFRAAINTDTGGVVDVGIEFHGYASGVDSVGMFTDDTAALPVVFKAKMQALLAGYDDETSNIAESFKAYLETLSADMAVGLEGGQLSSITMPADWKSYAQYAMRSITAMHAEGRWTNGPGVGSRDFNGSTDRIDWTNPYAPTAAPITISAWIRSDGQAGNADYILEIHASGDASTGLTYYLITPNSIGFSKRGTTTTLFKGAYWAAGYFTSNWRHVLVTHDGTDTDYTTIHLYADGVEGTIDASPTNGNGVVAPTGSYSIGGRIYDDIRNFDGRIAQVGVWNRVLTSTEIANLAAGYAPDLAAASGLQFYFKGNTSSLVASPGGTGTADGTTQLTGVGNGPSVIYA